MPPSLSVSTNLGPLRAPRTRYVVSEDEDEDEDSEEDVEDIEDVEDVKEGLGKKKVNQERESGRPPPPVSREILRLRYSALGASLAGNSESLLASAADADAFNPDWTPQDLEYTSLGFGKKTALFACESISFGC